jgi:hypothetical protein
MSRDLLGFKNLNESYSSESPAPVDYSMSKGVYGSYGGLILHPPDSKWKKYPANQPINKLLPNPIFTSWNGGSPLANETVPVNIPDDSMFIFARNQASPFCSSNYSTSSGQICTTKQQRDLISIYRGGNKCWKGNNYRGMCEHSNPDF